MWELILPFIASVAVTILLRRMDRSNMKLVQVRKTVNRALEDFERQVREKEKNFKDASIDFELQLRQGKSLITDLVQETEQVGHRLATLREDGQILENVQNQLQAVITSSQEIEGQVETIDNTLARLEGGRKEIQKLDSQLGRVKREAGEMVNAFGRKIQETSGEIFKALEERVGDIEESYRQKEEGLFDQTRQHLVEFTGGMEEQFQHLHRDLQESSDLILKNIHEKMDQYEEQVDVLQRESARAQEDARGTIHDFRKEVQTMEVEFQSQARDLDSRVTDTKEELSQVRETLYKDIHSEAQRVRGEIKEFSLDAIAKKDEIVNSARREAEGIHKLIEDFQSRYLEAENRLFREADTRNSELTARLDAYEEEFNRLTSEQMSELEKKISQLNHHYDEIHQSAVSTLEKKLSNLQESKSEDWRRELESMKDNLRSLQENFREQYEEALTKGEGRISDVQFKFQEQWQKTIDEIDQRTHKLSLGLDSMDKKLGQTESHWNEVFIEEEEKIQKLWRESRESQMAQLEEWRTELADKAGENLQAIQNRSREVRAAMDKQIHEMMREFEDTGRLFEQNNQELSQNWEREIRKVSQDLLDRYTGELESKMEANSRGVDIKLEGLQARLEGTIETLEEKSGQLRDNVQNSLASTQDRVSEEFQKIRELKTEILREFRQDSDTLQSTLDGLKSEVKEYQTVARVFTEADQLARDLDSKMAELKSNMHTVFQENDKIEEFMEKLGSLKEMRRDLDTEIKKIEKRSETIEEFENQVATIINLSDQVSARSESLEQMETKIDHLESALDKFGDLFRNIDDRFEDLLMQKSELEQSGEVMKKLSGEGNRLENRLGATAGQIEKLERKMKSMSDQLRDMDSKTLVLTSREDQIKAVEEKFEEIDDLLNELEQRQEQIQLMNRKAEQLKTWIHDRHEELEKLGTRADTKMSRLSDFLDTMGEGSSPLDKTLVAPARPQNAENTGSSAEKRIEAIRMLYQNRHWSVDEICKYLNVEKNFVETVIATDHV